MEAWGAQMELRAIQRRNRDATVKTRAAGRPKGKASYGFQYVRKVMGGKNDLVQLHPHAWDAELAGDVLDGWPKGMRLIVRKERPHPGAQLRLTDATACG